MIAGLVILALLLLWFGHRRARALSGKRPISYNIEPIPGRIRKPRRGERL